MNRRSAKTIADFTVDSVAAFLKRTLKKNGQEDPPPEKNQPANSIDDLKAHPWRLCPIGQHWVRTHLLTVEPTEKNPDGVTTRHGHCAANPNRGKGKKVSDYIEPFEMHEIARVHFGSLSGPPAQGKLPFENSDKYDDLIRRWTKYWNEVFRPSEPLDPDLIKALIASESGFQLNPKNQNTKNAGVARGFIQLTDQAIQVLRNPKGELKDHLVRISKEDTSNPNLSIGAGVRWLFHKKDWATNYLGREASWEEAIASYKGYLKDMKSGKNLDPKGMAIIRKYYQDLKK